MFLLEQLLGLLLLILPLLIAVAFLTLAERKIMGAMQQRKGPNTVVFKDYYNLLLMQLN